MPQQSLKRPPECNIIIWAAFFIFQRTCNAVILSSDRKIGTKDLPEVITSLILIVKLQVNHSRFRLRRSSWTSTRNSFHSFLAQNDGLLYFYILPRQIIPYRLSCRLLNFFGQFIQTEPSYSIAFFRLHNFSCSGFE